MTTAYQLRPRPLRRRAKTPRAPQYLRWLRRQRCVVCGLGKQVEAAHTGMGGMGLKASDWDAIPLCRECHRTGKKSYHRLGPRRFFRLHALSVVELRARLWARFLGRGST